MSDLLEQDLREALTERAARINPQASDRLRAVDYRSRWRAPRRVVAAVGLSGVAAAAGTLILLGSSAAPAFAGWTANPTVPAAGQLNAAGQDCGTGTGTPVLTDTRGPYTASIYANGSTCVEGNGIEIRSANGAGETSNVPAGLIELNGMGESDSDGNALTMVDGRIGAGVTGVTIARSDGSSVRATVANGWYLAWWPGTERAVTARVATTTGTGTQSFPAGPDHSAPACPAGAHCSSGYGFGSASGRGSSRTTMQTAGSASGGR